ncbi:uncharacterized protein LOC115376466 isoform X3 [Myripristis murdjan]|uniref:uncharacterized protein LOC115376466 isoform X3 n=1 Tax=Myripristis murdjan TaxID=586833 RepID=UPI0011760C96|nr:uncharacterized protein LOC115376466 isoform X3 [Myripristis murdjan]
MKGDPNLERQEAAGGQTDTPFGERRPSIVKLQGVLKRVSQSPFHHQYRTLVSSASDSSGSSLNESRNKQNGECCDQSSTPANMPGDHLDQHRNGLKTKDNHLLPAANQNGVMDPGTSNLFHPSPQNGVNGGLARVNPFYKYFTETSGKLPDMENTETETSEDPSLNAIFAPPPEFQSSPLDFEPQIQTFENNTANSPEPQRDLFQAFTHSQTQDLFRTSTTPQSLPVNGSLFHDEALDSPQNPFKTLQSNTADTGKVKGEDLFRAPNDLIHATPAKEGSLFGTLPNHFLDPFKSPSNKEDLFQSPHFNEVNPFHTPSTEEVDFFQAIPAEGGYLFQTKENDLVQSPFSEEKDLFDMSSKGKTDLFSPSFTDEPFQNSASVFDPFGTTPSQQSDPFQDFSNGTPDIFHPFPSKISGSDFSPAANSNNIFKSTPINTVLEATNSTPSFYSPPEMKSGILASSSLVDKSSDLVNATPPPTHRIHSASCDMPQEIVLTTPHGSKHGILQPTPFIQARALVQSPNEQSPTEQSPPELTPVGMFKRAPKPLPRSRPPRPPKPPKPPNNTEPQLTTPETPPKPPPKPLPKPVPRSRHAVQESKPVEAESYAVFEDILLIGQEKCVEDWPEDSPQLDPDFKPSGKFRLRRESLKVRMDSDGGSGEDQDGSWKKKEKKFKVTLRSRRGSKEKHESKVAGDSRTLPRTSKDGFPDTHFLSGGEHEGEDHNDMYYKQKKPLKTKVTQILRRASVASSVHETKQMNGDASHWLKDDDLCKQKANRKESTERRWSEGAVLDGNSGGEEDIEEEDEEEEEEEARHEEAGNHRLKSKKKVKIKFVPHRGFAISVEKTHEELKGTQDHTPRRGSKEKPEDEVHGAHGYTPHKKSQHAFMGDDCSQKGMDQVRPGRPGEEDHYGMEDCKPKKPAKVKLLHVGRLKSKDEMFDDFTPQKSSVSAGEMDDEFPNCMEDCKPKSSKYKGSRHMHPKNKIAHDPVLYESSHIGLNHQTPRRTSDGVFDDDDDDAPQKGADLWNPAEPHKYEDDEIEDLKLQKKPAKLKGLKKYKDKREAMTLDDENPPGATSSNYYLSEAAEAEWLAAQRDERLASGWEESEEEGDTDSLMEWWNTVEQWDEVPSDDEDKALKEDESKSFTILAEKVHLGLRVFNKVFTERAEVLWQYIIMLHAFADDISEFHQKAKIANITGSTTTAVGGVTAIAGLALAPITFGASLIVTAVGVGVAAAGGITTASATISDNVNNMHDRKKAEDVLQNYETHLVDISKILHFVNQGLYRLRGHPFLRTGTQHYSEDWEIRRAVQMISLVDVPVMRACEITDDALVSVQGLFKGMEKYYVKDSRELKKGCKKEVVGQIKAVAKVLNDGLVELNDIRQELQDANGDL